MKRIWLHSVRAYIGLGLFFYFKRIKVYDAEKIPNNKPVLFLSNHQNALLDALIIATKTNRFSYFLTRASVFQKPLMSKLLHSFNMLPVFRIRDGWSNLNNNNSIFSSCSKLLSEKKAVAIFPEGSHNLNRTVRPLSKGFTRIVFETLETYPDIDLKLIPIGLNFINAKNFPDSVSVYFGKSIDAKQYISDNKNEDIVNLKQDIQLKISELTTHIDSENYEDTLKKLDSLNVDFLNPKVVNACIKSNFENCVVTPKRKQFIFRKLFKGLFVISIFVPVLLWKYIVKPRIVEKEFLSTFRFALAITAVPIWMILVSLAIGLSFGWLFGLYFCLSVILLTLFVVKL